MRKLRRVFGYLAFLCAAIGAYGQNDSYQIVVQSNTVATDGKLTWSCTKNGTTVYASKTSTFPIGTTNTDIRPYLKDRLSQCIADNAGTITNQLESDSPPPIHGSTQHNSTVEATANKNQVSGYAGLNASSQIAKAQAPPTTAYTDADVTMAAGTKVTFAPSTTAKASWNLGTGSVAPSAPVGGDMWLDGTAQLNWFNGTVTRTAQRTDAKDAANGYAGLNASSKVPDGEIPSFLANMTADYTNATTTASNVSGMSFPVLASQKYSGTCNLIYSASATTSGIKVSMTGPATPTGFTLAAQASTTVTAVRSDVVTALSTLTTGAAAGTAALNMPVQVFFRLRNSTNGGTLQLQAASFGTGTLTIRQDSYCWMRQE